MATLFYEATVMPTDYAEPDKAVREEFLQSEQQ